MARISIHLILIAASLGGTAAWSTTPFAGRELVVDRAGNALVNFGAAGAFHPVVAVLDRSGNVLHCRPDAPLTDVQARQDAPGFFALRFESLAFPDSNSLERWDGQGNVEWSHRMRGEDFASTADGGAVVSEFEFGAGQAVTSLLRLDADGSVRWRERIFADQAQPFGIDLQEDREGRVLFAANPQSLLLVMGPRGFAHLGQVGADGRLAWSRREARASLTETRILDDGNGDFWWFLSRSLLSPPVVEYRASRLERRTAWGLLLATVEGPALVAGNEIAQPQADSGDVLWFLAEGATRSELVRLTREGRQMRHALEARIHLREHPLFGPTPYATGLSVRSGAAWLAGSRPEDVNELTVSHYTETGRSWSRRLSGLDRVRAVVAAVGGEARLLATNTADEGWLLSLDPRRGDVLWRKSLRAVTAACNGL